jgi:methionyl-tRNA synthetase
MLRAYVLYIITCLGPTTSCSDVPPLTCWINFREQIQAAHAAYSSMSFHEAVEAVVLLCSKGNQHLDETRPWTALKKVQQINEKCSYLYLVIS